MGRMKELWIKQHEELTAKYLEDNPDTTEYEAYEATAEHVNGAVENRLAGQADQAHEEQKERRREYLNE